MLFLAFEFKTWNYMYKILNHCLRKIYEFFYNQFYEYFYNQFYFF